MQSRVWLSAIKLAATLAAVCPATHVSAQGHGFPVPKAERGFRSAMEWVSMYTQSMRGDVQKYTAAAQPYGPLSLEIQKGDSNSDAGALKNFFMGVSGSIAKVDTREMGNAFHCGPPCAHSRMEKAKKDLPLLTALAKEFKATPKLRVVAHWSHDEVRVNNTFKTADGKVVEMTPAEPLGMIPVNNLQSWSSLDAYLKAINVAPAQLSRMTDIMEKTGWVAIVRIPEGVKVILTGCADNEAGIMFHDGPPPKFRDQTLDGLEYVGVEAITPKIAFYQTT